MKMIMKKLIEVLSDYSANIPMGNGADENVVLGPVQNKMQYDKIQDLIRDENTGQILYSKDKNQIWKAILFL
jgi:acyl-CoA reductase-like NAD-dependent aldehyde dehydrogenase